MFDNFKKTLQKHSYNMLLDDFDKLQSYIGCLGSALTGDDVELQIRRIKLCKKQMERCESDYMTYKFFGGK